MKVNKFSIIIGLIVFFQLQGFYLLNPEVIPTSDVAILLEIILFFMVYNKSADYKVEYKFKIYFIIPMLLILISACTAYLNFQQPIILGLRPQRAWMATMIMYFPISKLVQTKRYTTEQILDTIDFCNFIFLCLVIIQFIVGENAMFLKVMHNYRYDSIRLYVQTIVLMLSFMRHWSRILEKKYISLYSLFFVIGTMFCRFYIVKSRMGMFAFIGSALILLLKQRLTKKKLFYLFTVVVLAVVFSSSTIGQDLLTIIINPEDAELNSNIRELGRSFYIMNLTANPRNLILGCGFPNITWANSLIAIGYDQGYYLNDNGVWGQMYVYGLIYVVWFALFHIKLLKSSYRSSSMVLGFTLISLFGMHSLTPYCSASFIAFPISCAICEETMNRDSKKQTEMGDFFEKYKPYS